MKKYEKYKCSGIEWIDKIPQNWRVLKLGRSFSNIGSGTTPKSTNLDYYENGNINWLNTGDLNDAFIIETSKKITQLAIDEHSTLKKFPIDSIVIALYGATIGKLGHLKINTTTNQACCVVSESKYIIQRFLFYYFQAAREFIISKSYGGGQPNISQELIKQLYIPTPSLSEQTLITSYLDHKTTQIDTLIEKKEQLIKKLKLQRQAIINEAVTKGLNPDVPMKDSGIEWLGEIPEHWEVLKFRYLIDILTDFTANGSFGDLAKNVTYLEEGYSRLVRLTDLRDNLLNKGIYLSEDSHNYLSKSQLYGGEVLLANVGAYSGLAWLMPNNVGKASLGPNMFLLKFHNQLDNEFAYQAMISDYLSSQFKLKAISAAQPKINKEDVRSCSFILPPKKEQLIINRYIESKDLIYNSLFEKLELQIEKLKLYRQSIISEAVTGKIDVRDWEKTEL